MPESKYLKVQAEAAGGWRSTCSAARNTAETSVGKNPSVNKRWMKLQHRHPVEAFQIILMHHHVTGFCK